MRADYLLEQAALLVSGEKAKEHGDMHILHSRVAALWSAYKDTEFASHDVAVMMVLLKAARVAENPENDDNFLDMAGYAGIASELADPNL